MIFWPCILKLEGDDELIYLSAERDFISCCEALILTDDDSVIDSTGLSYSIELKEGNLTLVETERTLTINETIDLIRANEFQKAELCLTKIYFKSIPDAIESLRF